MLSGRYAAFLLALWGTATTPALPLDTNLLTNPGFEVGQPLPTGWRDGRAGPDFGRLRVTGAARTGRRCVQIDSYSSHYAQFVTQEVKVPSPGQYLAAAWVRLDGGFLQLRAAGSDGPGFYQTQELHSYRGHPLVPDFIPLAHTAGVSDTAWHRLHLVVTVPAGVTAARVEMGLCFTPGRVWVDDVYFGPLAGEPPPPADPEPSGATFSRVRGDWVSEWDYPRIARLGLPGAVQRPAQGPASRPVAGARLRVTEGQAEVPVGLDGRQVSQTMTARGDHTTWQVTVRNEGDKERWLTVELALPTGLGGNCRFWDGAEESPVNPLWRRRDGPLFMFPLTCVYNRSAGVALGLSPDQELSHFAFEHRRRGGQGELACSARLVVEPHSQRRLEIVAFRFAPRWAWREAVQVYHSLFPRFVRPSPGLDPRVLGGDGFVYGSVATRPLQMEECRRFATDWEWVYGQFQTPGDWYPDAAHWDPHKGWTGPTDLHHNEVPGTLEDYFAATRDRFRSGRHACAMLFYFVPQCCERKLLEAEYPDSWWIRADGSHWPLGPGYTKTDDDTAVAWPANTSFGAATVADMRRIAEDFGPAGFAFDVAHGFQPYFGPAQRGLPGRAWTREQSFALESVALGVLMDEVHRLRAHGYRLAVAANGPYTYMVGRRSDVTMFEPSPFAWQHYLSRQWPVRLLNGGKIIYFHAGRAVVADLVRAQQLTPEAARETIAAATDALLQYCLWLGGLPPADDLRGSPRLIRWAPVLREVVRAGWQPVPAIEADAHLVPSRYGEGVGSFLVLSNPTRAALAGQARIQAGYVGQANYLLCRYDGRPLPAVADRGSTRFAYALAPRESLICRMPLAVSGGGTIAGTVTLDPEATASSELVAEFRARQPGGATIQVWLPPGAVAQHVACNGVSVPFRQRKGHLMFTTTLVPINRLVVRWEPAVRIAASREDLLAFPLIVDGKAACAVVTAPGAAVTERAAAQRLQVYVEYYLRRQGNPAGRCWSLAEPAPALRPLRMDSTASLPAGLAPVLVGPASVFGLPAPAAPGGLVTLTTWRGQRALLVTGSSPARVEQAMLRLLSLLDARYAYFGVLPDSPLYQRAGLAGETAGD